MSAYVVKIRGVTEAPREYRCDAHGAFELVVDLATSAAPRPCPTCSAPSERTLEANIDCRMGLGYFRGKSDPPPSPLALDTRALARGEMTERQFRDHRRRIWREHDRAEAKRKGLLR